MFLVALAAKRDEPEPLRECEIEQRTGHSRKRWRLVVFPPEPPQHPVQMRDADRPTEPRTRRVLGNRAAKVRETHASRQRKPRQRFVLIFEEERPQMPCCDLFLGEGKRRSVVGDQLDRFIVMLTEAVQADARVVLLCYSVKRDLSACVLRCPMLRGAERNIILVAVVVRTVVVIKRGNGQQQARLKSMHPGKSRKPISLPLHVANAGSLCIRVVGNLIIVPPERGDEPELIVGVTIVN